MKTVPADPVNVGGLDPARRSAHHVKKVDDIALDPATAQILANVGEVGGLDRETEKNQKKKILTREIENMGQDLETGKTVRGLAIGRIAPRLASVKDHHRLSLEMKTIVSGSNKRRQFRSMF